MKTKNLKNYNMGPLIDLVEAEHSFVMKYRSNHAKYVNVHCLNHVIQRHFNLLIFKLNF